MNSLILSGMAWASSIKDAITTRMREERGQDLIEYAVLVGAIGIAAAVAFIAAPGLGEAITNFATNVKECIGFEDSCG